MCQEKAMRSPYSIVFLTTIECCVLRPNRLVYVLYVYTYIFRRSMFWCRGKVKQKKTYTARTIRKNRIGFKYCTYMRNTTQQDSRTAAAAAAAEEEEDRRRNMHMFVSHNCSQTYGTHLHAWMAFDALGACMLTAAKLTVL